MPSESKSRIEIRWRTTHKAVPPHPIKLQIPGWSGHDTNHGDGARAQPWHCPPFVEGSTYGLELVYPFQTETIVTLRNGYVHFEGDLREELHASMKDPPFKQFAANHFGLTSMLDLVVPEEMVVRIEPHPRFYTDETGTCPCAVPGHIHSAMWPRIFFVVFKAPREGQRLVFQHGEPYAQILVVPRQVGYDVAPLEEADAGARERQSAILNECSEEIAKNSWTDDEGRAFNDKYRVLQSAYRKGGREAVEKVIEEAIREWLPKKAKAMRERGRPA